jgi:type VI secretion system secreted protein Hcp
MAYEFYVTIEGTKQGKFKGESPRKEQSQKIAGLGFQYEVISPRDAATGRSSGQRRHQPITIVKEWGAATPQLFQALVSNEQLKSVAFEFFQTDNATGKEAVYFKIHLTNAFVSAIKQFSGAAAGGEGASSSKHSSSQDAKELEAVSFTFEKIELEHVTGKTSASDDWQAQR